MLRNEMHKKVDLKQGIGNITIARFLRWFIFGTSCLCLSPLWSAKESSYNHPVVSALHPQHALLERCLNNIQSYVDQKTRPLIKQCRWSITDPNLLNLVSFLKGMQLLPKNFMLSIPKIQSALKTFQNMHELPETGVLDQKTLTAANGNQQSFIDRLEDAQEDWCDLGALPKHYALVNIPSFHLELMVQGESVLNSRVIVGKHDSKTPTFEGFIYAIDFNPTWSVPRKHYKDYIQFLGKDGFYLKNGDLFQKPGPKNNMGQVKFLTRRSDAVLLHGTQKPELFSKDVRSFSLGCVRVQECVDLAEKILDHFDQAIDISSVLLDKKNKAIVLKNPFPVYVVYHTLWIKEGVIFLYPDIYDHADS